MIKINSSALSLAKLSSLLPETKQANLCTGKKDQILNSLILLMFYAKHQISLLGVNPQHLGTDSERRGTWRSQCHLIYTIIIQFYSLVNCNFIFCI